VQHETIAAMANTESRLPLGRELCGVPFIETPHFAEKSEVMLFTLHAGGHEIK
jgi:hypothetical protein